MVSNSSGSSRARVFRFGVFEADENAGELRKQGRRLPIQGQPLQVLVMLLERPGEIVARTDIQQQLWPDGTFVDFDHGLNTAINKIRDVLGDSAASPRFVETLARRGYRFITPVEVLGGAPTASAKDPPNPQDAAALSLLTDASEVPQASHPVVRWLCLLLQGMYLCFYVASLARFEMAEQIVRTVVPHTLWVIIPMMVTAVAGIPIRLYLIASLAFRAPGLREKFLKLFPLIFPLDELWGLAPFLLVRQIGFGLALGSTAALLYAPFAQRALILMGAGAPARRQLQVNDRSSP
jgi:cholera toxin transcriptional activator